MKTKILTLLFGFGLIINGYAQSQSDLLEKAYKKKSVEMLTRFFDNWADEIKPNENAIVNDTILEAYRVFKEFYHPTKLSLLGGSEWGDSIYKNSRYFITQAQLKKIFFVDKIYSEDEADSVAIAKIKEIHKNDSLLQSRLIERRQNGHLSYLTLESYGPASEYFKEKTPSLVDSIIEFYPHIDNNHQKVVYLTKDYLQLLNNFLGNSHSELGKGSIMNPAYSKGESKKRKDFLDKLVTIFYGHWGGYWQLYTYPVAYSITFDRSMKYAKVDYQIVYEGGEAVLEKKDNHWKIIRGKRTWIE